MILIRTNIRIYSYQENYTNEYPNIFVSRKLIQTNVRINIRIESIWIFEYIRHTLVWLRIYALRWVSLGFKGKSPLSILGQGCTQSWTLVCFLGMSVTDLIPTFFLGSLSKVGSWPLGRRIVLVDQLLRSNCPVQSKLLLLLVMLQSKRLHIIPWVDKKHIIFWTKL